MPHLFYKIFDANINLKEIQTEYDGSYTVVFEKRDSEITVWIENWRILESTEIYNCRQEEREVGACIEIYDPVCANNYRTYSNGCFACQDLEVDYYQKGEC